MKGILNLNKVSFSLKMMDKTKLYFVKEDSDQADYRNE